MKFEWILFAVSKEGIISTASFPTKESARDALCFTMTGYGTVQEREEAKKELAERNNAA